MKKNLLTIAAILIIAITFGGTSYAQFGDLINKAKDAAKKKKDKPKEQTPTEQTNGNGQSTDTSGNKQPQTPVVEDNPLGTIYFSNKPFPAGGSVEGAKTSFSSNEFIYARLVLKGGTVREVLKPAPPTEKLPKTTIHFGLNRQWYAEGYKNNRNEENLSSGFHNAVLNESDFDKTYFDFDLLPSIDNASTVLIGSGSNDNYRTGFVDGIYNYLTNNSTEEGTYTFGVEITIPAKDFRGNDKPMTEWSKIRQEISYTFSGKDFAVIKANKEKLEKDFAGKEQRDKIANQELPEEWKLTTNRPFAGVTELALKTMYLNRFTDKVDLKVVKIYTASPRSTVVWTVVANEFGIPTYRYANQWHNIFVRNVRTNECFFQGFKLRQQYSGSGTYSASYLEMNDDQKFVSCEKMGLK